MPGDPFKKVQTGDKLEIPAAAWNALMELAQKAKTADISRADLARLAARIPCLTALVRNDSGADRDVFDYVTIRAVMGMNHISSPHEYVRGPLFRGEAPNQNDYGRPIAIYIEPCKTGQLGLAIIGGIALAKVNGLTNYGEEKSVDITPGDCTQLTAVLGRTGVATPLDYFSYGNVGGRTLHVLWVHPWPMTIVLGFLAEPLGGQLRMKLKQDDTIYKSCKNIADENFWGQLNQLQALWPPVNTQLPFFRFGDEEVWSYFCPPELAGIDQTVSIDTPGTLYTLTFEKGHLVSTQATPKMSGVIEVGGDIVPGDAAGRFFPVPGLWNGMPQWQNAQNPNWWIRWEPGNGRWVIGQWPQNAQQGDPPQQGWAKPQQQAGQPPNQNPVGEFPDNIGDVDGVAQTTSADYFLQECNDQSGQAFYRCTWCGRRL